MTAECRSPERLGAGRAPRRTARRLLPPAAQAFARRAPRSGTATCPTAGPGLLAEVERSGLRGKGGARFPTATKLAAVASRRRAIVVANGTEGEPASLKDTMLMSHAPHLVLDGAVLAAEIVGAREVDRVHQARFGRADRCSSARSRNASATATTRCRSDSSARRNRYVSGEETALVNWLNGGDAKPTFVPPRPFERGVDGRPTLVQNVETLGDLALDRSVRRRLVPLGGHARRSRHDAGHAVGRGRAARRLRDPARLAPR